MTKHIKLTHNASASANITAIHRPFTLNNKGNINIIIIWNTKVLKNDITPDTTPLLSPVKNADAKTLNPLII